MPNVSVAKQGKRMLMSNVVHSMLLYGAPVWVDKMAQKGWQELQKVQRRIALRVASAYYTTSKDAVLVIAGTPPIDRLARKHKIIYELQRDLALANIHEDAENELITSWQDQWDRSTKGRWTHRLIKEIKPWRTRSHGTVDYWLTQALSGHGCYGAHLHKYGRLRTAECGFSSHPSDDVFHTFFVCEAWANRRYRAETDIGETLSPDTMIEIMLRNDHTWSVINNFIHEVLGK